VFSRVRTTRARKYCADPIAMCNKVISDLLIGCFLLFSFRSLQQVVLAAQVCDSLFRIDGESPASRPQFVSSSKYDLAVATCNKESSLQADWFDRFSRLLRGAAKEGHLSGPQTLNSNRFRKPTRPPRKCDLQQSSVMPG
jgi:hypothetical protein